YVFQHALLQEVAYESLLKRTRQQLHTRVAQALETQFADRTAAQPEIVARHYHAAGLLESAIAHYQRAGRQAAARPAHEEAVAHFRAAIAALGGLPKSADHDAHEAYLHRMLAPSLTAVRGYAHPELEATYERARELFGACGDRESSCWPLFGLANVCLNVAKF